MNIEMLKKQIEQKKQKLQMYREMSDILDAKLAVAKKELYRTEKAHAIIQNVAQLTQDQITLHIEEIVNCAIDAVFPDQYQFNSNFVSKRDQTECEISLIKDDEKMNPMTDNGGGVVDVLAFALRIALWNIQRGEKLNTIILDEPFRFLSQNLKSKASEMIQDLSKKLNIQFIIVTHDQEIINIADQGFIVTKNNDVSTIETIDLTSDVNIKNQLKLKKE